MLFSFRACGACSVTVHDYWLLVTEQIFSNIYLLVIGKLFSAADLGFFTRANSMQECRHRPCLGWWGGSPFRVLDIQTIRPVEEGNEKGFEHHGYGEFSNDDRPTGDRSSIGAGAIDRKVAESIPYSSCSVYWGCCIPCM